MNVKVVVGALLAYVCNAILSYLPVQPIRHVFLRAYLAGLETKAISKCVADFSTEERFPSATVT